MQYRLATNERGFKNMATKKKVSSVNSDKKFKGFSPQTMPPVPKLKLALVCAVDEPKMWEPMAQEEAWRLPKIAGMAALMSAQTCFFCGHSFATAVKLEEVERFHPEYPLCDCLLPLRDEVAKKALDLARKKLEESGELPVKEVAAPAVVPEAPPVSAPAPVTKRRPKAPSKTNTPWGNNPTEYLQAIEEGKISDKSTAYTYTCKCGRPCSVIHGAVAKDLRERKTHRIRTICHACFKAKMSREPKAGHGVRPSRLTQKMPKLPTLEELTAKTATAEEEVSA